MLVIDRQPLRQSSDHTAKIYKVKYLSIDYVQIDLNILC